MKKIFMLCSLCLVALSLWSQHTITGTVKNKINDAFAERVTVAIKGNASGNAMADDKGAFRITVPVLPVTLVFSSIGLLKSN